MRMFNKLLLSVVLISTPLSIAFYNSISNDFCGNNHTPSHHSLIESLSEETRLRLQNERSVNSTDICQMPEASLQKAIRKLNQPKPDHPGEAKTFRYMQQLSKNKQVNVKNWQLARQQVEKMRQLTRQGAGINATSWESIGPGNIGGRIRSFAFDPDNSNRIYAGAVSGGVWLTENAGQSWAPTDDFMGNLSVSTIIFDPNNRNTIYAGTGEGTFNIDNVRGMGIFKSTNKGVSWTALASTQNSFNFYWVNRLTMLNNSTRLLAATHTGIWTSDDAGISWTSAYNRRSNDVDVHPSDNNKLIAGTWGQALYSLDGGQTWNTATGLSGLTSSPRIEVAYAKSNPDVVYASIDNNSGEIWKSTDGGQSYTLANTGHSFLGSQGWYDNALWVDPVDENQLVVGGLDLWRSSDGGTSFTKISRWWDSPNSAHADHHFILEHPGYDGVNNKQVYFANDGGMYTTPDLQLALGSVGWQELNNNLTITQFYGIGISPDGTVVGGTQDNGTLIYKGNSEGWTETFGGDGGYSASDPTDSNYIYGEYVNLNIHRSTNGGISSSYIFDSAITSGANFIAPFILDPNNVNRLLGGSTQLWISNNAKAATPTWTSIKPAITSNTPISAIAVAPGNSDIIYVGHNNGALYKTLDGTNASPTWTEITTPGMPQRYLMRIAIDPVDTNTVFVSYGGYENDNLWKSTDAGTSWNTSSGTGLNSIPTAPIRTIAIHSVRNNQIYVGTEIGIFTSEDGGTNWSVDNNGPANVSVDELVWHGPDTLYAGTHGRGIFKAKVSEKAPNTIIFTTLNDQQRATQLTSETKTINGISVPVDVSIVDGEYSLGCNGIFTTANSTANSGNTICLRHTSSSEYWTTVDTKVTIGDSTFSFKSKTVADITPDSFSFSAKENVALNSQHTSNAITVAGISHQIDVIVTDGEYSVGCNDHNFTSTNGTITLGDTVCVRHTASSQNLATTTTQLTLGDTTKSFQTTTLPDTTPDAFSFAESTDTDISTVQTSAAVTPTGFQVAIPISITGGEYSINCSSTGFTNIVGEISPNQSVCVRHTSSAQYVTTTTTTLDINGVTANFVSTTSQDKTPDSFSFTNVTNAEISTQQVSNTVAVNGIAVDVAISITGGEFSIGCNDIFTTTSSVISNGGRVCVRHTSSSLNSTTTQTTLTVGTFSAIFSSTTKETPSSSSGSGGGSAGIILLVVSLLLIVSLLFVRKR